MNITDNHSLPVPSTLIGRMTQTAALLMLRLLGWRPGGPPPDIPKYIAIGAYHTSNWDALFMLLLGVVFQVRINFMIKDSWFRGPLGPVFHWLGGVAIDRSQRHNTVDQIAEAFKNRDRLILVVAPEGTRKKVPYWKTGFYYIALKAGVPIVFGYLDYGRKTGGFGPVLIPSGDIEADMAIIRDFYADITARYPEKAGEVRLRPHADSSDASVREPALVDA